MNYTFGFIGVGNMGGALAKAACRRQPEQVVITNKTVDKAVALAEQLDCDLAMNNEAVARDSKFVFLGVKPNCMQQLLQSIAPTLENRRDKFVLVSMAAGLTTDTIIRMLGFEAPVIRIMPNTPVAIGMGVIPFCTKNVEQEDVDELCDKMSAAGYFDPIEERLMDAAASLSGCGPAFVYQFIEALADGAVACGLPRQKAVEYAARTLQGSAGLVLESGKHSAQLKDEVCSPGGSTIAGVHALEKGGLRAAAMDAVLAACDKNAKLGKA